MEDAKFCVYPVNGRACDGLASSHAGGAFGHPFTPPVTHCAPSAEPAPARLPVPSIGAENELADPSKPMQNARIILRALTVRGVLTLRHWRGSWMRWADRQWAETDAAEIRHHLYGFTENAVWPKVTKDEIVPVGWNPNRAKIADLTDALAAAVWLDSAQEAPSWLGDDDRDPTRIVACRNGLLDLDGRRLHDHTPLFFNQVAVPFDYAPDAPPPARWLSFLASVWPDDPEAVQALQEWFGYVLSGRTDLEKILLIVGPRRSGKGTIARILTQLIGMANVAGPTMSSLTTNFGLSPLVGKSLAVVDDARMPKQNVETIVERLLTISGRGMITVDRKHREQWDGKLPTRLMLLSNELPAFRDTSGALPSRLIILTMEISNLGREDLGLSAALERELPGILNWALDGLDRLTERGRIVEPASSAHAVALLDQGASPIRAFLADRCTVDSAETSFITPKDDLFAAWQEWCREEARDHPGTKERFSRELFAAQLGIKEARPRVGGVRTQCYVGVRLDRPAARGRWSGF